MIRPLRLAGRAVLLLLIITSIFPVAACAGEWSGFVALESRFFLSSAAYENQGNNDLSLAFEPEFYHEWNEGRDSFTFTPYLRFDSRDSERTHLDLRELSWQRVRGDWELRIGWSKVFWGVTESQHLVDIVNQTDLVENFDGEDKLGQQMIRVAWFQPWGTLEFFSLPGFRERTFPGRDGRLRPSLAVDTEEAQYESAAEDGHIDLALRWSHVLGPVDVGVSYFKGTGREPLLRVSTTSAGPKLIPFYEQIDQFGLDLQATVGGWLWKLETIQRQGLVDDFTAITGGFEYTFTLHTGYDVGVLVEYLWDERGSDSPTPFEEDVFVGSRWALNDTQSTEILAGAIFDVESDAAFMLVEASRRLGASWKLELEWRGFSGIPPMDPAAAIRSDDHLSVKIARYF